MRTWVIHFVVWPTPVMIIFRLVQSDDTLKEVSRPYLCTRRLWLKIGSYVRSLLQNFVNGYDLPYDPMNLQLSLNGRLVLMGARKDPHLSL